MHIAQRKLNYKLRIEGIHAKWAPQGAGNVIDLPQKSPETKTWIFEKKTIWVTK